MLPHDCFTCRRRGSQHSGCSAGSGGCRFSQAFAQHNSAAAAEPGQCTPDAGCHKQDNRCVPVTSCSRVQAAAAAAWASHLPGMLHHGGCNPGAASHLTDPWVALLTVPLSCVGGWVGGWVGRVGWGVTG
jgi:hypothetical protein